MQKLVKDFNYIFDWDNNLYELVYLDSDFKTKTYKQYKTNSTDETLLLLLDVSELAKLGFRYNPYLTKE